MRVKKMKLLLIINMVNINSMEQENVDLNTYKNEIKNKYGDNSNTNGIINKIINRNISSEEKAGLLNMLKNNKFEISSVNMILNQAIAIKEEYMYELTKNIFKNQYTRFELGFFHFTFISLNSKNHTKNGKKLNPDTILAIINNIFRHEEKYSDRACENLCGPLQIIIKNFEEYNLVKIFDFVYKYQYNDEFYSIMDVFRSILEKKLTEEENMELIEVIFQEKHTEEEFKKINIDLRENSYKYK